MKRRAFLKTVGGATGAAAVGAVSIPNSVAQGQKPQTTDTDRLPTYPYGLDELKKGADSHSPSSKLRVREPFWYPDGSNPDTDGRKRVFLEEAIGINSSNEHLPFPVEFEYKGQSKKWILGGQMLEVSDSMPAFKKLFTKLVRELGVQVRKYNASLYRLRRLHYCMSYKDEDRKHWPHGNPDGGDAKDPLATTDGGFEKRRDNAEMDWGKANDDLNGMLEAAKAGYPQPQEGKPPPALQALLMGIDMIAVNGYIVSMRVVVRRKSNGIGPLQTGGSSSHVSISSPFSSASG